MDAYTLTSLLGDLSGLLGGIAAALNLSSVFGPVLTELPGQAATAIIALIDQYVA